MKITRMDIKGFGRIRQAVFEPGPGLNLVHGPNESGKSTLLAFIGAMLYGLRGGRRGRDGEPPPLRRHEPWPGGPYAGVLEYVLDDGSAFRIGRNFTKGTIHVQDGHANDITTRFPADRETGPQFADAHLGVDEETFGRTLFVGQMKTVLDTTGRRNVMDSLLRIQDSGRDEMTFRQAEEALQKALLERVGSERSTVRPMDRIQNRLAELGAEATSIRQHRVSVRETAMSLAETKKRLDALRSRQASCRLELARCRSIIREGERLERLDAIHEGKDRLLSLSSEEASLAAESADLADRLAARSALASIDEAAAAQLPFDLGRRRELLRAAARMDMELSRKMKEIEALESELPPEPAWRDVKRLDTVLQEYLALREQVGSAEERKGVLDELNGGEWHWPVGITGAMIFAVLSISTGALASGLLLPGTVPPDGFVGPFLVGVSGLAAVAAAWLLGFPLLRHHLGGKSAEPVNTGRDDILRWNRARKAFESLLAETGVSSMQEFFRIRGVVDMVGNRLADLAKDTADLSERGGKLRSEADTLSVRTSELMASAGFRGDDDLDAGRMQSFQGVLRSYRDDRSRAAIVNMRLEAIRNERAALHRSLGVLEEDAGEWGDDLFPEDESSTAQECASGCHFELSEGSVACRQTLFRESAAAAAQVPGLQESLEQLRTDIAAAQLTEATLETRLERAPTEDRLQQVLEESDRLETRRVALHAYGESLGLALEALRESAAALRHGVSPRLDGMTGDILSAFTDGRHRRVGTDDQLSVRIEVAESVEMASLSQMSGGTADQVWLAVRLASVKLLEEGRESLPLFLDEPFAQFDEQRTAAALSWLRERAGDRQIFLFTCRKRDKELTLTIFGDSATQIELS